MQAQERIAELEREVARLRREQEELDDELSILVRAERDFFAAERNLERQMGRMARLNDFFIEVARCSGPDDVLASSAALLQQIYPLPLISAVRLTEAGGVCAVTLIGGEPTRQTSRRGARLRAAIAAAPFRTLVCDEVEQDTDRELIGAVDEVTAPHPFGPLERAAEHVVLILSAPDGSPVGVVVGSRPQQSPRAHFFARPSPSDAPFLDIIANSIEASFDGIVMRHRLEVAARELEDRVRTRTAELTVVNQQLEHSVDTLRATQRELIEASRLAGMSEVATGVLHNVGNVLNSVNVSASLVGERVATLLDGKLERLATLLEERPGDIPEADVPRLVQYVRKLAHSLDAQKAGVSDEAQQLVRNVAHIRNIVSTQQSFAKAGGVVEVCTAQDMVDDMMTLHREALANRCIAVAVNVDDVPELRLDRHKVLQILVNLMSNAIQAVAASGGASITVRVHCVNEWVQFSVDDDGVGIAPDNLARVFAQGFTTRVDGHGFGLHASACAARELGGELTAHSDGIGHGARFVLRIPVDCALAA